MATTPILEIIEVAPAQDQKEDTINQMVVGLEAATQDWITFSYTSNARTLTRAKFTMFIEFVCRSNGASAALTVKLTKRFFMVNNQASGHQVTCGGSTGTTLVVPGGAIAIVRCDGTNCYTTTALATTAGVLLVGGVAGAIGVTGNRAVVSGTLTLSGMAAEAVPAVGPVVSDGTHVSAGNVGGKLGFNVTIAAVQDLINVLADSTHVIGIHSVNLGQITQTTVANLRGRPRYLPATVTNGSGDGAGTVKPLVPGDAAASATSRINDTTQATTSGTAVDLWDDV